MSTIKQTELKSSLVSFFHFYGKFTGSDIGPIHQRLYKMYLNYAQIGEKLTTFKGIV